MTAVAPGLDTTANDSMDPFQVLGIAQDATDEQIRAAYLLRVREYPPDEPPRNSKRSATHTRPCATLAGDCETACCGRSQRAAGVALYRRRASTPIRRTRTVVGRVERKVTATPGMNRDDLKRRFEQWLDSALAAEDPTGRDRRRAAGRAGRLDGSVGHRAWPHRRLLHAVGRDDRADG